MAASRSSRQRLQMVLDPRQRLLLDSELRAVLNHLAIGLADHVPATLGDNPFRHELANRLDVDRAEAFGLADLGDDQLVLLHGADIEPSVEAVLLVEDIDEVVEFRLEIP